MAPADKQNIEVILEICLDRILNGQETIDIILDDYPTLADELRPRLEAALWLTAQKPDTQPRPEFIRASSQRLMAQLQRESRSQTQSRQPHSSFWQNLFTSKKIAFQFALVIIVVFSTLFFSSGLALAAQNALPGEMLYPVKTSFETAQLAVTFSPVKAAQRHIQYADRRLVEMQSLSVTGQYDDFETTINNLDQHITQALQVLQSESIKDASQTKELAKEIERSLSKQEQTLAYLKTKAPAKSQVALQRAVEISAQGVGIAQKVIEASSGPSLVASITATNTLLVIPSDTVVPSETQPAETEVLVQPASTLASLATLAAIDTQQPASTISAVNTPKPTNTHRPTQKPTKEPKPTKTPKPSKPTKTPKK